MDDENDESILNIPQYLLGKLENENRIIENIETRKALVENEKFKDSILKDIKFPPKTNKIDFSKNSNSDYRCIKIPLLKIGRKMTVFNRLNYLACEMKKLKIVLYLFIRSYILHKFNNISSVLNVSDNDIHVGNLPIIDEKFVDSCIRVLTVRDNRGPPITLESKKNLILELNDFYKNNFKKVINDYEKINVTNCSQLLAFITIEVVTNYENAIKVNFFEYFFRFMNEFIDHLYEDNLKDCDAESKKKLKKHIQSLTKKCKLFFLHEKYEEISTFLPEILWLKDYILPKLAPGPKASHYYQVKADPQRYLPYLINMNIILENIGRSTFQVLPLSKNMIPDHIKIDTKMMIDLFINENKNYYLNNIKTLKYTIWNQFFVLNKRIFKDKGKYAFDYLINTDGISATLSFFKIGAKKYTNNEIFKKKEDNEIPYIDELTIDQLNRIKNQTIAYDDPGKKNIHYIEGENGGKLRYTSKQRIRESERNKHQRFTENFKNKTLKEDIKNQTECNNSTENKPLTIKEIESKLSESSAKTYDSEKFNEYMKKKVEVMNKLSKVYQDISLRKWRMRAYINKQRSESKLVDRLLNIIGKGSNKQICIFIGNWSQTKQMRNFVSTPGIGLIKRIMKLSNGRIKFVKIDEFRTSCIYYKTGEMLENKEVIIEGFTRKLHSVLTRKGENGSMECIHRENNSVKNYRTMVQYYLKYYTRPIPFIRGVDKEKIKEEKMLENIYNELKTENKTIGSLETERNKIRYLF